VSLKDEHHDVILDTLGSESILSMRVDVRPSGHGLGPSAKNSKFGTLVKLEQFPNLQSLHVEGYLDRFELPNLPNLKDLNIEWHGVESAELKSWIGSKTHLEFAWVDGESFESLIEVLPLSVRSIHLSCHEDRLDVAGLARLTNLESLSGFSTEKTRVTSASELPKLRQLFLQGFQVVEPVPQQWIDLQHYIERVSD